METIDVTQYMLVQRIATHEIESTCQNYVITPSRIYITWISKNNFTNFIDSDGCIFKCRYSSDNFNFTEYWHIIAKFT